MRRTAVWLFGPITIPAITCALPRLHSVGVKRVAFKPCSKIHILQGEAPPHHANHYDKISTFDRPFVAAGGLLMCAVGEAIAFLSDHDEAQFAAKGLAVAASLFQHDTERRNATRTGAFKTQPPDDNTKPNCALRPASGENSLQQKVRDGGLSRRLGWMSKATLQRTNRSPGACSSKSPNGAKNRLNSDNGTGLPNK